MANPIRIEKKTIDEIAFNMVRKYGLDILSVRNIAKEIGCSTKPIYRVYKNMEELKQVVIENTIENMKSFIYQYKKTGKALLDSGLGYICFAKTEKELFKLISMTGNLESINGASDHNQKLYDLIVIELAGKKISEKDLIEIYEQLTIFTYGLTMLCFFNIKEYSEDELENKLYNFFITISEHKEKRK